MGMILIHTSDGPTTTELKVEKSIAKVYDQYHHLLKPLFTPHSKGLYSILNIFMELCHGFQPLSDLMQIISHHV